MRGVPGSSRGACGLGAGDHPPQTHHLQIPGHQGAHHGSSRGHVQNLPGRLGSTEHLDRTQDGEQVAQTSARPCSPSGCLIGRSSPQGLGDGSAHLLRP